VVATRPSLTFYILIQSSCIQQTYPYIACNPWKALADSSHLIDLVVIHAVSTLLTLSSPHWAHLSEDVISTSSIMGPITRRNWRYLTYCNANCRQGPSHSRNHLGQTCTEKFIKFGKCGLQDMQVERQTQIDRHSYQDTLHSWRWSNNAISPRMKIQEKFL